MSTCSPAQGNLVPPRLTLLSTASEVPTTVWSGLTLKPTHQVDARSIATLAHQTASLLLTLLTNWLLEARKLESTLATISGKPSWAAPPLALVLESTPYGMLTTTTLLPSLTSSPLEVGKSLQSSNTLTTKPSAEVTSISTFIEATYPLIFTKIFSDNSTIL